MWTQFIVGGPLSHGPPPALGFGSGGGGFGGPPSFAGFPQPESEDDYSSSEQKLAVPFRPSPVLPIDDTQPTMISTTARAPASTSSAPTSLTLSDIRWLDSNIHAIHLNETDYMIARNQTVSRSAFKTILNYFSKTQKTETDLNYFIIFKVWWQRRLRMQ